MTSAISSRTTRIFIGPIAIFLTVFALNQFGEGLREATDPRTVR